MDEQMVDEQMYKYERVDVSNIERQLIGTRSLMTLSGDIAIEFEINWRYILYVGFNNIGDYGMFVKDVILNEFMVNILFEYIISHTYTRSGRKPISTHIEGKSIKYDVDFVYYLIACKTTGEDDNIL